MRSDDRPDRLIDMLRAWFRFVIVSWKKRPHGTVCDVCGFGESHVAGPVCPECGLYGLRYRSWREEILRNYDPSRDIGKRYEDDQDV